MATGMRQGRGGKGGGGDKEEERQCEVEQAQRGCWLLAGQQGSERRLITLVSMPTAIKQHTHTRLGSEYPPNHPPILFLMHARMHALEKKEAKEGGRKEKRG